MKHVDIGFLKFPVFDIDNTHAASDQPFNREAAAALQRIMDERQRSGTNPGKG